MAATSKPENARVCKPLTQQRLKEVLHYDPAGGGWARIGGARLDLVGTSAGSVDIKKGGLSYLRIWVDGRRYYAHQLAFLYMTGAWTELLPDHRDGNGLNNSWENIRTATYSQNCANTKISSKNSSGFKGVSRATHGGNGWRAYIYNGKQNALGVFDTAEEAAAAYRVAARRIFGEYARP